jgi:hypothetical protein
MIGYGTALAAWAALWRLRPTFWPKTDDYPFEKPWREVGYALLAAVGIIVIGQLYVRGIRLPNDGSMGTVLESINQILIFSPMVILLLIRKQPIETAWIKKDHIGWRVGVGMVLGLLALGAYSIVRADSHGFLTSALNVYRIENIDFAVQVFLEDFSIAVLATRLSAAIGFRRTVVFVAALFAAGHIPTMIANGVSVSEFSSLFADTALGVAVISAALYSRDIWWLWPLHFTMDMSQFERITGVAG